MGQRPTPQGVDTFPHHTHTSETEVIGSDPTTLEDVLREIEEKLHIA